ncbi:MAG: S-layer homology domain-containing protein, partial [Monoglobales bacterium]
MNKRLLKLTAIILIVFMLPITSAFAEESVSTPEEYMEIITSYYSANTTLTNWWDVVALYGAGVDLSDYTLPEWTSESLDETSAVTDYAGIIFGLIASGENVHDVWGRDIAEELAEKQDPATGLFGSFPNQQIYSILALDAAKEPYNRTAAIDALIDFRAENGAFGYSPTNPDIDLTAMALLVLDKTRHAAIINSCVTYIAESQLENGGFSSWGIENSNTLCAVISAIATLDLLEDERFIKNNRSLAEVLSDYILDSGMLTWEAGYTDENLMATQQGLIAYGDIVAGKSVFLRLESDEVCSEINAHVRIEGSTTSLLNTSVTVKGYDLNLVDAIKKALDLNDIPYVITGGEYGAYIQSIGDDNAGKFGGYDGWLVALNGAAISSSADRISLTENDEILLYYGMFEPYTLIPQYTLSQSTYLQNSPFTITVTATYFDYNTSRDVTVPIPDVTIDIEGITFTTGLDGRATITPIYPGVQTVKIYKEDANSYPSIVRIVPFTIDVAPAMNQSNPSGGGGGGGGGGSYIPPVDEDEDEEDELEKTSEEKADEEDPAEITLTYGDKDDISNWAVEGVKKAVSAGLFKGDDKGNINPQKSLTRAELATILLRLTNSDEVEKGISFDDVSADDWYYKAVSSVYKLGFMTGTGSTTFAPDRVVTREQAAVVLARILKLTPEKEFSYSDADEISDWAKDAVNALSESKIMEGYDNKFSPQDVLTREMCAVIMA